MDEVSLPHAGVCQAVAGQARPCDLTVIEVDEEFSGNDCSSRSGSCIGSDGVFEEQAAKFAKYLRAVIARADGGKFVASAQNFLSVPHDVGDHFHFVYDGMKGLSGQVLHEAVLGCFCSLVLVTQQLQQQKQQQPNG